MIGHGSKFGRKKEGAIGALLSQRSIEDAARTTGIGVATLMRWMKIPEFNAAYRDARRAAVSQANARLQQATGAAAATFLKLMVDQNVPAACRIRAAECVMNYSTKAIEIEDIEARLSELEKAAEASRQNGRR